ncbi:MAG: hypothetical protein PHI49_04500 [Halothiobacillaceae bacterium]|nr:hypothetical protein [Halothiobacillaceae bacterium]
MKVWALTARDIQLFSLNSEPEMIIQRGVQLRQTGFRSGYRDVIEEEGVDVKKNRQFSAPRDTVRTPEEEQALLEHMAKHGYGTIEHARHVLAMMAEAGPRARAKQDEFDRNATPEQKARAKAFLDRCMLSLTA